MNKIDNQTFYVEIKHINIMLLIFYILFSQIQINCEKKMKISFRLHSIIRINMSVSKLCRQVYLLRFSYNAMGAEQPVTEVLLILSRVIILFHTHITTSSFSVGSFIKFMMFSASTFTFICLGQSSREEDVPLFCNLPSLLSYVRVDVNSCLNKIWS